MSMHSTPVKKVPIHLQVSRRRIVELVFVVMERKRKIVKIEQMGCFSPVMFIINIYKILEFPPPHHLFFFHPIIVGWWRLFARQKSMKWRGGSAELQGQPRGYSRKDGTLSTSFVSVLSPFCSSSIISLCYYEDDANFDHRGYYSSGDHIIIMSEFVFFKGQAESVIISFIVVIVAFVMCYLWWAGWLTNSLRQRFFLTVACLTIFLQRVVGLIKGFYI